MWLIYTGSMGRGSGSSDSYIPGGLTANKDPYWWQCIKRIQTTQVCMSHMDHCLLLLYESFLKKHWSVGVFPSAEYGATFHFTHCNGHTFSNLYFDWMFLLCLKCDKAKKNFSALQGCVKICLFISQFYFILLWNIVLVPFCLPVLWLSIVLQFHWSYVLLALTHRYTVGSFSVEIQYLCKVQYGLHWAHAASQSEARLENHKKLAWILTC